MNQELEKVGFEHDDKSAGYVEDSMVRERFKQRIEELVDHICSMKPVPNALVFLDKAARPLSWALRIYSQKEYKCQPSSF